MLFAALVVPSLWLTFAYVVRLLWLAWTSSVVVSCEHVHHVCEVACNLVGVHGPTACHPVAGGKVIPMRRKRGSG